MKKRIFLILFIIICLVIIGIFMNKQLSTNIEVKEYRIGEVVLVDINNDGKEEKIQVTTSSSSNENTSDNSLQSMILDLNSKIEFDINIDDNNYKFYTKEGESVLSFGIADLNLDNRPELLVCVHDNLISPSYRKWNIYKYDNENLIFTKMIYDGYIKYDKLTNKLNVEYNLHETEKPMTKKVSYDIDF